MTRIWNTKMSIFVAEKLSELRRPDSRASDDERAFAASSNAVQVYADMSGTLGVTPDGTIRFQDSVTGVVQQMKDDQWITIATVSAAAKYPALKNMLPVRPITAKSCTYCEGTGKQMKGTVFCGKCSGLGWK